MPVDRRAGRENVISMSVLLAPPRLFGPLLFFEIVRLARRTRYIVLRTLFALSLLILLWLVVWKAEQAMPVPVRIRGGQIVFVPRDQAAGWRSNPTFEILRPAGLNNQEMAKVAETFFYAFMMSQFLVVLLFTPAYTAGAIAEDKEHHRLEFLFATDLHNLEIVLSKLIARVVNLCLLIMVGLPVISIMEVWGGIDPGLVLVAYLAMVLTIVSLGALCIYQSVHARRARDAIITSYLFIGAYFGATYLLSILLGYPSVASQVFLQWPVSVTGQRVIKALCMGNPLTSLAELRSAVAAGASIRSVLPALLFRFALFHVILSIAFTWAAVRQLRKSALEAAPATVKTRKARRRLLNRLGIDGQPIMWKEILFDQGMSFTWAGRAIVVLIVLGSFIPAVWEIGKILFDSWRGAMIRMGWEIGEAVNLWVRQVGTLVACLTILGVAVRAAGSVSGEKERQTYDSLACTPIESSAIVCAKWASSLWSARWGVFWLFLIWILGVGTGGLYVFVIPWLILAWLVYASFFAMLGLWFSLTSQSTLRATIWTLAVMVGLSIGHWLPWTIFGVPKPGFNDVPFGGLLQFQLYGLTPPLALGWFAFRGDSIYGLGYSENPLNILLAIVEGFVLWLLAGYFLFQNACLCFRQGPPVTAAETYYRTWKSGHARIGATVSQGWGPTDPNAGP